VIESAVCPTAAQLKDLLVESSVCPTAAQLKDPLIESYVCPTAAQLKDPLVSDDMFALMENTKIISGYRTDYSAIVFLFFNIPCQTWQGILEI
jgi:hypothetical protein